MKAENYDLIGSYDNQRVSSINAERSVNLFEYMDANGKKPKVLLPTAGLVDSEIDLSPETSGARQSFVFDNEIFNVYGKSVFRTTGSTDALSTTRIGEFTNLTGTDYVGIDANTFQVIFVDGEEGWIWDKNTQVFAKITDPSFPAKPIDVCYIDGFFIVANGETNTFQMSLLNQGLVWGADFASGTGNAFTATSGASPNLVLSTGTTANYQVGTPIKFNGGGVLPTGTPAIVIGATYYVKTVINSTTFTISTTPNGTAITFSTTGSGAIFVTNNGQLQLGAITSHPGTIVACKTLHRRIFFFSQNYTEVWENAGLGTTLPIRRNNSLLMEVGTPAVASVVVGFDRMFFLAQDRDGLAGVMGVGGTEATLLSNRALDFQLAQYAENPNMGVADARGVLIKENGLIFYRLNFTFANHTFVLNVSMSTPDMPRWHEEELLNGDRHPAQTHAYFDGVNYYGDYKRPLFYVVDDQSSTNNGEAIRRMRIGRQMTPEGYNRIRVDRFQVDLLQGAIGGANFIGIPLDLESGEEMLTESGIEIDIQDEQEVPSTQPVVFLSISKDGAQSFGNLLQAKMGKIGERTYRTVWRKIGVTPRGQGFIPKIEFFHDIPFIILGAAWAFEVLPE
jgi:hypothetical protein